MDGKCAASVATSCSPVQIVESRKQELPWQYIRSILSKDCGCMCIDIIVCIDVIGT